MKAKVVRGWLVVPSLSSARQSQMAFIAMTQLLTKHKSLLEHLGVSEKLCRCSIMLRESKPKVADQVKKFYCTLTGCVKNLHKIYDAFYEPHKSSHTSASVEREPTFPTNRVSGGRPTRLEGATY